MFICVTFVYFIAAPIYHRVEQYQKISDKKTNKRVIKLQKSTQEHKHEQHQPKSKRK